MERTQIVFLLGLANSGKDTIGQMFVDKGFERISFADAAKQQYAEKIGIDVSLLHIQGEEKEKYRAGLIEFAESKRKQDPLYWLKTAFAATIIEDEFKEGLKLIITDCRRIDEITWVRDFKHFLYNVNQSVGSLHYVDLKLFLVDRENNYDSDILTHTAIGYAKGIDAGNLPYNVIDATILNDSSLEVLQTKVDYLFKEELY